MALFVQIVMEQVIYSAMLVWAVEDCCAQNVKDLRKNDVLIVTGGRI